MTGDVTWEPPGPGHWYASPEHMPEPVTTLFGELFPRVVTGWGRGAERYGLPPNPATFGESNRWLFYSPGAPGPVDVDALERVAAETLATERWRADLRRWHDQLRPEVVAENRALVAEQPTELDDPALAEHLDRAIAHYLHRAPEHFAETAWQSVALGVLFEAAAAWDLDPYRLLPALAGASAATSSAEVVYDRIASALRGAGVEQVDDLDSVRAAGGDAAAALDELLVDYPWRTFHSDLAQPTLAERPAAIVQGIRAALSGRADRCRPDDEALATLRALVPADDRPRFDDLVEVARAADGANDDNTAVLYAVPLGLVRRSVLEAGRRLVTQGRIHDMDDALEATRGELQELLARAGPSADDLGARASGRHHAASSTPSANRSHRANRLSCRRAPSGSRRWSTPISPWRGHPSRIRSAPPPRSAPTALEGRAVVPTDPTDAAMRLEPGDVLEALTTTAPYNTIFPMASAVAVEHGGLMSHATVLARELGIPAVIGIPGLLDRVHDGDRVRVDPQAGTITVLERAT